VSYRENSRFKQIGQQLEINQEWELGALRAHPESTLNSPKILRFNAQSSPFSLTIVSVALAIQVSNLIGGETMDEKGLLELWNTKRSQVISAQIAPTLMLIGVFVLAAYGKFETATDAAKYLTIGVAAATGILAIISQYATIREAEILLVDLKRLEKPSELSKRIADSRSLLSLSAIAMVGLGVGVFALVVWAVLG